MKVIFPGSFDPITYGHLDIIERAIKIFDEVIVAVVANPTKNTLFTIEDRVKLINQEIKNTSSICNQKVYAEGFTGLLVDFVKSKKSNIIIRGLRAVSDYEYETQMALINKNLYPQVETFFVVAKEDCSFISSSIVKQVSKLGGDVSKFVSKNVQEALISRFKGG